MKRFILSMAVLITGLLFIACSEENIDVVPLDKITIAEATELSNDLPTTTVTFDRMTIDLGEIAQGAQVSEKVYVTNTGSEPLIISSMKGSCGCTVAAYPKAPVAPGDSAAIELAFNSKGKEGKQHKAVTMVANTDPNPVRLYLNANVLVAND